MPTYSLERGQHIKPDMKIEITHAYIYEELSGNFGKTSCECFNLCSTLIKYMI